MGMPLTRRQAAPSARSDRCTSVGLRPGGGSASSGLRRPGPELPRTDFTRKESKYVPHIAPSLEDGAACDSAIQDVVEATGPVDTGTAGQGDPPWASPLPRDRPASGHTNP